jgi:branched-chain amino acid transport system ATP-binding protein
MPEAMSHDAVLLRTEDVSGSYVRGVNAVHSLSVHVRRGEVVSLLGVNGAGKTTTLRLIAGAMRATTGTLEFDGHRVTSLSMSARVSRGITLVPQGHQLFPDLTVQENLELGAYARRRVKRLMKQRLDQVTAMFPALESRMRQRAGSLSGGERAMVAVGRGLMSDPKLLLLDEPSAGLSPVMRTRLFTAIAQLAKEQGLGVVLAEQDVDNALAITDRVYVLQSGKVIREGDSTTVGKDIFESFMGIDTGVESVADVDSEVRSSWE